MLEDSASPTYSKPLDRKRSLSKKVNDVIHKANVALHIENPDIRDSNPSKKSDHARQEELADLNKLDSTEGEDLFC